MLTTHTASTWRTTNVTFQQSSPVVKWPFPQDFPFDLQHSIKPSLSSWLRVTQFQELNLRDSYYVNKISTNINTCKWGCIDCICKHITLTFLQGKFFSLQHCLDSFSCLNAQPLLPSQNIPYGNVTGSGVVVFGRDLGFPALSIKHIKGIWMPEW